MNLLLLIKYLKSEIKNSLEDMKLELKIDTEIPEILMEFPAQKVHGDLSSNVAMSCAKKFKMSPREIARKIVNKLNNVEYVEKCEIAGPGFINFFLNNKFFKDVLIEIDNKGKDYGKIDRGNGKSVLVEFVSSNPTGPMHIGNARLGALGDSISSVLSFAGYNVSKEFYVNDAGNQIKKFADSLASRYVQIFYPDEIFPEDGYHGDDIKDLAIQFANVYGDKFLKDRSLLKKEILNYALPLNIKKIKSNLYDYRVEYDNWFHESTLYSNNEVDSVIEALKSKNATYNKDNTLWFKASAFGSEKDEVLVRKNGIPTYFAADIAYHFNKFFVRKFDVCINFLGADHHGHVSRMHSAMKCLGVDSSRLIFVIVQMVRIIKNGEVSSMSKRSGKSETLENFLKIVNVDSARFVFSMFDPNSTMDFDIDLAIKNDSSNPSYYIKYAYARIQSILKLYKKIPSMKDVNLDLLDSDSEKYLIFVLSMLPYEINESSNTIDPTKIARYALKLASAFHKFYNLNKVKCEDNLELSNARCFLCLKTSNVLKQLLNILKVSSPSNM